MLPRVENTCTCANGQGAEGEKCAVNDEAKCASCADGFYLSSTNACETNVCSCDDGEGATGLACEANGNSKCASCNDGYYLESNIIWQKVNVFTSKKSFQGNDNFEMALTGIPSDATYALVDIFITVGANDHIVFNFAADPVPKGQEWLSRGQDPNSIFQTFASKHNHLSFNYAGQNDEYTPNYGMWYSSQHLPIKNGKTNFRTNGAGSTSAGYVWVRVRAYSRPSTDINDGLSYQEVKASYVEWKFTNTQYGSQTMPSTVPEHAEYALCDFFLSSNKDDHQNFVFSDVQVGAEKNWVNSRGDNPEGQINAKTQTRQEVTITYNGESDGFTQYYGIWWSSQLVPIKSRKFFWGNYGNSNSEGYVFMRVRGFYGMDSEHKRKQKIINAICIYIWH